MKHRCCRRLLIFQKLFDCSVHPICICFQGYRNACSGASGVEVTWRQLVGEMENICNITANKHWICEPSAGKLVFVGSYHASLSFLFIAFGIARGLWPWVLILRKVAGWAHPAPAELPGFRNMDVPWYYMEWFSCCLKKCVLSFNSQPFFLKVVKAELQGWWGSTNKPGIVSIFSWTQTCPEVRSQEQIAGTRMSWNIWPSTRQGCCWPSNLGPFFC